MHHKTLYDGWIMLGAGLLASSLSSLFGQYAARSSAMLFFAGLLEGLAAVAFTWALIVLIRARRSAREDAGKPGA